MKFMKLGSKPDSFQTNGNDVRFVATEVATDIVVNVGDTKFYLHKFPLLSKSSRLQRSVTSTKDGNDEVQIADIPGGAAAFEICAKFCYGMTVTLNAYNVIAVRCAAEYLEMHETTEKGNLIYKIEVFLNTSIFRSWRDSITVLRATKSSLPWAEDLKLVGHCVDSIACKASVDASMVDWSYTYNRNKQQSAPKDWWVEDLCELGLDHYKRVMVAIGAKGRVPDKVMGEALKAYTCRRLPGFAKGSAIEKGDGVRSRPLLETVVRLLPEEKGCVSCGFLTRMLKAASFFDCSEACRRELVRRIGRQLDEATVPDLLLPAPPGETTAYDVDTVLSMVEEFVMQESPPAFVSDSSKMNVAKLVDGYLAEIGKDRHLPLSKFLDLAEMVAGDSRPVHDGLYRAVDMYLRDHPSLTKSERKKLCGLMDCRKLSAEACAHAVQNERLPLRTVVQVLFHEQTRSSAASGHDNGTTNSYGSSRSAATTNTADDNWDGATLPTVQDIDSFTSTKLAAGARGSASGSSIGANKNAADKKGNGKAGGMMMPKKILGKLLSSNGLGGGSDTSGSPDEPKSTPTRIKRRSVSRD